jgi:putative ABC transport system permease protein
MRRREIPGLRRVLQIGVVRRELDDELAFHFERTVEELMSEGSSREAAEAEARRRFGNERAHRRAIERIDRSRAAGERWHDRLEVVRQSVWYGLRRMGRAPGFTAAVVLTFGLGIGANATMFGVLDRLLLQPPAHITEPGEVRRIMVEAYRPQLGERDPWDTFTYPDYVEIAGTEGMEVAALTDRELTVGRGPDATRHRAYLTTGNYFGMLGVTPAFGRFYGPADDQPGAAPVAVISYAHWRSAYGGDPEVIGRTLDFGYGPYEIIGVAPDGFTGTGLQARDLWMPLSVAGIHTNGDRWVTNRRWYFLRLFSRLDDDVTAATAASQATARYRTGRGEEFAEELEIEDPRILVTSLIRAQGPEAPPEADVARWLMAISLLVLLIACANVANLLLARAVRQRREIGIRLALGSSRARVLGQVLVDSLLMAMIGGLAAVAVTHWGAQILRAILLPDVAWGAPVTTRVAVFIAVLTALAGAVAGVIPAIQASRPDVAGTLKGSSRTTAGGSGRTRAALTVVQAALSVVLLIGAGLFVRSLQGISSLDLGFDPRNVMLVESVFDREVPDARQEAFYEQAVQRLERLPGVVGASVDRTVPFWSISSLDLRVPGLDSVPTLSTGGAAIHEVSPSYFEVMDLRVVRGRPITDDDTRTSESIALVNETMARVVWPGDDPIGKCMVIDPGGPEDPERPCSTIVGVVENSRNFDVIEDESMHYYVPVTQKPSEDPPFALMVRLSGDPETVIPAMRRELLAIDPGVRFAKIQPFRDLMASDYRSWELGAAMFSVFGLLALVVAGIGLYSVLAFSVAERTFELGIRAALGATRQRLIGLVMRQALSLVGAGVAVGLVIALLAGSRMEPMLYEVSPRDPLILGMVALTMLAVGIAAAALPASRATRADPSEALRSD